MPGRDPTIEGIIRTGGADMLLLILLRKAGGAVEFDEEEILAAKQAMHRWPERWRRGSDLFSVGLKRGGWVDLEGAHPDVYEITARDDADEERGAGGAM